LWDFVAGSISMKSIAQYAVLLVIIVGGVFGLTFLTQNTRTPIEKKAGGEADKSGPRSGMPLDILQIKAEWDADDPQYAAEFERGIRGHYDFWMRNLRDEPVNAALLTASCVCTEVQLGIVPPAEMAAWRKRNEDLAPANVALGLIGVPNLAGVLTNNGLGNKVKWTVLNRRDKDPSAPSVKVPPADPANGPQWALLRMGWDTKETKSMRLTADIQHSVGNLTEITHFEVPTLIVPPAMISTPTLNVGDLNFNERREVTLYVWSATRDHFSVTIEDLSHDPCIDAGPPRLLTPEERIAVTHALRANVQIPPTKMRCGYEVPITVYERRGSAQLDLGPLNRKLMLLADVGPEPTLVALQGMVRGAIDIGAGVDQDRVNLGAFPAKSPHEKTVIVTAKDANVQLRFKKANPDYLAVTLTESPGPIGFKQWRLRVEIDANKVSGLLPSDSAIYLETVATPPRAIRIPVIGNGTAR
jgi:hypothetical protein